MGVEGMKDTQSNEFKVNVLSGKFKVNYEYII